MCTIQHDWCLPSIAVQRMPCTKWILNAAIFLTYVINQVTFNLLRKWKRYLNEILSLLNFQTLEDKNPCLEVIKKPTTPSDLVRTLWLAVFQQWLSFLEKVTQIRNTLLWWNACTQQTSKGLHDSSLLQLHAQNFSSGQYRWPQSGPIINNLQIAPHAPQINWCPCWAQHLAQRSLLVYTHHTWFEI